MMRTLLTLVLCGLLAPSVTQAEEQLATTLQTTPLYAEPYSDAATIATLRPKQQVTVLLRKGGWYQVQHGSQTGWLRMSYIRFGDGTVAKADGSGVAQTLRLLSTGRSGASGVTVATGIRGLDSADMVNATPDHQAVNRLDRYQATTEQAQQFAAGAHLKSQPLGYIGDK